MGSCENNCHGTFTNRPSFMTEQEHDEAEGQGWSVFEVERSDESEVMKLGDVFWDANYQVRNLWDTLDEKGSVELRRVRD